MEVWVRIAIRKYYKTGEFKSENNAIIEAFEKNLDQHFSKFDCHKWWSDVLWNEANDWIYKRYWPVVKEIYAKNSGKLALPGAPKFICMEEFFQMILDAGVVSDSFGQWEIGILYTISMMTQVDEIDKQVHMNMTLVEFIEAIAWVVDKINLPVLSEQLPNQNEEGR